MQDKTLLPLSKIAVPFYLESLLRITLTSADVVMLGFWSDKAVSAVGLVMNITFFMQILYMMVSSGTNVVIAQNLGAKRYKEANDAGLASIGMVSALALALSILVLCLIEPILSLYKLDPEVHGYARDYLTVFSAGSIFMAVNIVQSTILRAHGFSKDPMFVTIFANIFNVAGNAIFIFGLFGAPKLGVMGVAISTVSSQFIAFWVLGMRIKAREETRLLPMRDMFRVPRDTIKSILGVGVPIAGENLSFNIGQLIIMGFIAGMDPDNMNLAANTYAITLLRFVFMPAMAIGVAAQIKTGYWVGAGQAETAKRKVYGYFAMGAAISLGLALILNIAKGPLLGILAHEAESAGAVAIAMALLPIAIFYEPGRCFNIIVIPALKGAGDVRFPAVYGMISMWGVGVVLAYVFGVAMGMGLIGIWLGMAADEWSRGLIMMFRWRSGVWKGKSVIKTA